MITPDKPAPWYQIARGEMALGIKERKGDPDHPKIIEYHDTTSLHAKDDETPWCSSFVNWCIEKAGIMGTKSARARSWLGWGEAIEEPRHGCVVVFSRPPSPTAGHVGFYIAETPTHVDVLGGNQSNQVNIASYPKDRVLGYRWPNN